ncbi:MAG TPA: PGPGW domain-containing protein [Acidimicrobiales bacterium]
MHPLGTLLRFIWRSSRRAAVFTIGVALLAVGFVMFVTPGPGIVLVVAGLAVLATEFAWAEHLLDRAKAQAARAGNSAQRLPGVARATATAGRLVPRRRRAAGAGTVTVTAPDGTVTARAAFASASEVTVAIPDGMAAGGAPAAPPAADDAGATADRAGATGDAGAPARHPPGADAPGHRPIDRSAPGAGPR